MLIKVPERQSRIIELEDEGSFALAIQDAERIRRNAPAQGIRTVTIEVVVVVGVPRATGSLFDGLGTQWTPIATYWSGSWELFKRMTPRPEPSEAEMSALICPKCGRQFEDHKDREHDTPRERRWRRWLCDVRFIRVKNRAII